MEAMSDRALSVRESAGRPQNVIAIRPRFLDPNLGNYNRRGNHKPAESVSPPLFAQRGHSAAHCALRIAHQLMSFTCTTCRKENVDFGNAMTTSHFIGFDT